MSDDECGGGRPNDWTDDEDVSGPGSQRQDRPDGVEIRRTSKPLSKV